MIEGTPVREFCTSLVKQQTKSHAKKSAQKREKKEDAATIALGRRFAGEQYRLPPTDAVEEFFRHSGWRIERERVRAALTAANVPAARLDRFNACGGDCVAQWSQHRQRHRIKANFCGDRFCVPCCRARSVRAKQKLFSLCKAQSPLFITLTLRASDAPLAELITQLLRSFAKLRRHVLWSRAVRAGAYVIEVKKGQNSGRWHPHIHVLAIGSFMPQARLSDAWKEASGGSFMVDVQRVWQDDRAVGYVGKYVAKGWSAEVARDPDGLIECVLAMRGRRLLGTFGDWRGVDLEHDDQGPDDWKSVGRISRIYGAACRGEGWAVGIFRSLRREHDVLEAGPLEPPPD